MGQGSWQKDAAGKEKYKNGINSRRARSAIPLFYNLTFIPPEWGGDFSQINMAY